MCKPSGAQVLEMDVQQHDQILAATSHLPHLLAYSLVDTGKQDENRRFFRYAAGGFRVLPYCGVTDHVAFFSWQSASGAT